MLLLCVTVGVSVESSKVPHLTWTALMYKCHFVESGQLDAFFPIYSPQVSLGQFSPTIQLSYHTAATNHIRLTHASPEAS